MKKFGQRNSIESNLAYGNTRPSQASAPPLSADSSVGQVESKLGMGAIFPELRGSPSAHDGVQFDGTMILNVPFSKKS